MKRNALLFKVTLFLGLMLGAAMVPACAGEVQADANVIIPMDSMVPTRGYPGTGKVNSVDANAGRISLNCDPIASLGWAARNRDFQVLDRGSLTDLKPGQRTTFELVKLYNGKYVAIKIALVK